MNLAETHDLLTLAAAYDNRRFDDATVAAWREVLAPYGFDDCRAALVEHFADSTAYLMPAHVVAGARARRAERAAHAGGAPEQPGIPLAQRSANGQIEHLRAILPATRADILRRHEWYEHDRARQRHLTAVPNPDYDPAALGRLADAEEAS